jgi:hypothetical protein
MTPEEIETTTRAELYGPFPYADCHRLQEHVAHGEYLIPDLDIYFAEIAGYGSSASRLKQRDKKQLHDSLKYLRMTFFEKHPEHRHLKEKINNRDTPELERYLRVTNTVRLEILPIIERLANEDENGKVTTSEQ